MLTDILEIEQKELETILNFNIYSGGNTIVFGPAGSGKTEMSIQAAEANKFKYKVINLSVIEAIDLVGLPFIKEGVTNYANPNFLPLDNSEPQILIFDEIDKASDEIQNPLLELFQFRKVNGRPVNIKSIIATGNLPNERAKSRAISHALANRCQIYKMQCNFQDWKNWAVKNNVNNLIVDFLTQNNHMLVEDKKSTDPTAYCFPSPRAWTKTARDLDHIASWNKYNKTEDLNYKIISSRVGTRAATMFQTWFLSYQHIYPLIDKMFLEKQGINVKDIKSDQIIAMTVMVVERLLRELNDGETQYTDLVFNWLSKEIPSEFCFAAIRMSQLTAESIAKYDLHENEEFINIFDKIQKTLPPKK